MGGTKPGQIAYIGETNFGNGDWAGVVLDEPIGIFFKLCSSKIVLMHIYF